MVASRPNPRPHLVMLAVLAAALLIGGPASAQARTTRFGDWPEFAFVLPGPVNVFWLPRAATFAYYGQGYYFRWQSGQWLASENYDGPWKPCPKGFILPRALEYGPPPPIQARPSYFVWWRKTAAPWWHLHHRAWWQVYGTDLAHYRLWQRRALPTLLAHPRFWDWARGRRLQPDFLPTHPTSLTEVPSQTIRTKGLNHRIFQNERNVYEWSHTLQAYPGWGYGGYDPGPWAAYPPPWAPQVYEGWYTTPWFHPFAPSFQLYYGHFGIWHPGWGWQGGVLFNPWYP